MKMSPATRMMVMGKRYGESSEKGRRDGHGGEMRNGMHEYDHSMHDRYGGNDGRRERYSDDDYDERHKGGHHREKWSDREMIATGSAWINPGRGGHDREYQPVDERQAMEWVHSMQQPEGGRPMPAFKPDEAEALRKAHCPECDKWEFFVTLNMKYSDLYEAAKKLNMDKPEFYVHMAKAFLCDKDAGPHKLQKYMEIIPK